MSPSPHKLNDPLIILRFERNLVRYQLVVQSRLREGFGACHVAVEDVPEVLDRRGYDAGAAGGAEDEIEGAVRVLDYGGGYGAEGAGMRADVVGGGGDVAEFVADVGDGEVWRGV